MKLGKARTITPKNFPKLQFRQAQSLATGVYWLDGDASPSGKFVTVGFAGVIGVSTDGGVTWSNETPARATTLQRIRWLKDRFVAVGNSGTVVYSTGDGNWHQSTVPAQVASLTMHDVTYDAATDRFVVAGQDSAEIGGPSVLISTDNCQTFTMGGVNGIPYVIDSDYANTIDIFNGVWIMGTAFGNVWTSRDLDSWEYGVFSTNTGLETMLYGDVYSTDIADGMWVAACTRGDVHYTTDGVNFTSITPASWAPLIGMSGNAVLNVGPGQWLFNFSNPQNAEFNNSATYVAVNNQFEFDDSMIVDYDGLTISQNASVTLTPIAFFRSHADLSPKFPGFKNIILVDFYGQHLYSEVPF